VTPQETWSAAYHQLELQIDRMSFDTWLRNAQYLGYETSDGHTSDVLVTEGVFYIGVHNDYAVDMLQSRLYRVVRKVVSDIAGFDSELVFQVQRKKRPHKTNEAPRQMPLFEYMERQSTLQEDDTPLNPFAPNPAQNGNGSNGHHGVPPDIHAGASDDSLNNETQLFQDYFSEQSVEQNIHIDEERNLPWHQVMKSPKNRALDMMDGNLNPSLTFERFVVNKSNQMVYDAARAVADYPGNIYNPFLVYGGVGLGKTHILLAIANACKARGLRTMYLTTEAFTNDLIDAIRTRTTAMFRDKYRSVDVLLVDDIQFITGKEATQEEFFHTFNALVNFNKQVVLASDRHPRELVLLEDRLRSRFEGGLVADIQPPEYETRLAILGLWAQETFQEQGTMLEDRYLATIAQQGSTNVRELRGQFNKIVAQAKLGRLDTPVVEDTLTRYHHPRHRINVTQVIESVARAHGLQAYDLTGKRRTARINRARQIAMYLAREMTELSLPQIGEAFGGRAHTTVLHGWTRISEELQDDRVLEARVNKISQALLGR
jgi:chromosomal replication initiator protein